MLPFAAPCLAAIDEMCRQLYATPAAEGLHELAATILPAPPALL